MTRHRQICLLSCFFLLDAISASAIIHRKREGNVPEVSKQNIPKLLHYIYLPGYEAFRNGKQVTRAMTDHFDGCQKLHNHWDSIFWNEDMGRNLIQRHYAWFLPKWETYDEYTKGQALSLFVMDHYGGMYLEFDVECYKSAEEGLQQYDMVLQGGGNAGLSTAVVASVPGHPAWMILANQANEDGVQLGRHSNALSAALSHLVVKNLYAFNYLGGVFKHDSYSLKIWPMGEWFEPCYGLDQFCLSQYDSKNESVRSLWDTTNLYGRRYFTDAIIQEQTNSQTIDSILQSRQQ